MSEGHGGRKPSDLPLFLQTQKLSDNVCRNTRMYMLRLCSEADQWILAIEPESMDFQIVEC